MLKAGIRRCRLVATVGPAVLALFMAAAPARAETIVVDPEQLLRLAILMIDQGRPDQALAMANALLAIDPHDAGVLALKSRAERDLGLNDEARASARASWQEADNKGQSYDAAMAMAQALASDGQKFRAQFWLRRAMAVAPDPVAQKIAERDFAYVRSRSRLWLRFDASIQPSSNLNNGSANSVLWMFGLPLTLSGDAQALSGIDTNIGASLRYRIAETNLAKTDLTFSAMSRQAILSSEAKALAPTARGSDYAYTALEIGVTHVWRPTKIRGGEAKADVALGRDWYGGAPMSDYLRLETSLSKAVSPTLSFNGNFAVERQDRLDSPTRSANIWTTGLGLSTVTKATDRISVDLSFRDTASASTEIDHQRLRLDLDWTKNQPVLGARFTLGVWAEARDYQSSRYSMDGRQDQTVGAALSMAFEKVDYMGFVPVVTLKAAKTNSNIGLFDSETLGVGFSVRSKF